MANLRISELTLITPDGTEYIEGIVSPYGPNTNRRMTAQDIANLGSGVSREFGRAFSEELLFNKNYIECDFETVTSDITYTIAALGNLVDQESVLRQTLIMDGVAAINFSGGGFNHLYGITDGEVLAAGEYDIYFAYSNGAVSVSLPGATGGGGGGGHVIEDEGTPLAQRTNLNFVGAGVAVTDDSGNDKTIVTISATTPADASETVKGILELSTQAEVTTGTNDVTAVTPLKLATETRGIQDLYIPVAAMWPRVTSGCEALAQAELATSLVNIQSLNFDTTTQEFAQFQIVMPRKWNNGTITFKPYWTAASGTGTVQWGLSAGAYRNDDALTVALGTAQTSDDTLLATNDLHIGPESSAITIAGTLQDENFIAFQISRNPASDTLSADAKLLGISIRITVDSAKDA